MGHIGTASQINHNFNLKIEKMGNNLNELFIVF